MNLRPASRPPLSSKPTRPPYPPLRYVSARRLGSPVIRPGKIVLITLGCLDRYCATAVALLQCWRMRSTTAWRPWMNMNALNGDMAAPTSRRRVTRALVARVRVVEHGEAVGVFLPVKIAAIDDDAADRCTVATDIFRR